MEYQRSGEIPRSRGKKRTQATILDRAHPPSFDYISTTALSSTSRGLQTDAASCDTWPSAGVSTVFKSADRPASSDNFDGIPLVLGLRFYALLPGTVTAFRFYKAASEVSVSHLGSVYEWASGTRVASTGPFASGSCNGGGWVRAPLLQPLRVVVGREYVVAVDSVMRYPKTDGEWAATRVSGALEVRVGAGVFGLVSGEMPRQNWGGGLSNYWVDGTHLHHFI